MSATQRTVAATGSVPAPRPSLDGEPVDGEPVDGEPVDGEPVDGEPGEVLPLLRFVRPMPGFAGLTRFALVRLDGADEDGAEGDAVGVLFELRSLDQPEVRFLVAAPTAFFPDYSFELEQNAVVELGLESADDALVLVVLTVGADAASTTANLLAPVVVNARTRDAAQVILSGTEWPVRVAVV